MQSNFHETLFPQFHFTKHIIITHQFIREKVIEGDLEIEHVVTWFIHLVNL